MTGRSVAFALRRAAFLSSRRKFASWHVAPTALLEGARIRGGTDCHLSIGRDSTVGATLSFERSDSTIAVGERSFIGRSHFVAAERVQVGDDVLISWGVTIVDHGSHSVRFSKRREDVAEWRSGHKSWDDVAVAPVVIGSKTWIGFDAIVLKGVCIGEGAIVGAGAIVTRDVAPWTIVAGNPARLIRQIPENER